MIETVTQSVYCILAHQKGLFILSFFAEWQTTVSRYYLLIVICAFARLAVIEFLLTLSVVLKNWLEMPNC
jgi:hypothetical protein